MRGPERIAKYVGGAEVFLVLLIIAFAVYKCPDLATLARELLDHGEVREAEAVIDRIKVDPNDAPGLARLELLKTDLAVAHADPAGALEHVSLAVKATPNSIPALVRQADILDLFCKPKEGLATLTQMEKLRLQTRDDSKAAGIQSILDQLPESFQLPKGEIPTTQGLLKSFDTWLLPYRKRLASYARWFQDLEVAIKTMRALYADHPEDVQNGVSLSHLLAYHGDAAAATELMEKISKEHPEAAYLKRQLSLRFRRHGDPEKAVEQLMAAGLDKATLRKEIIEAYVEAGRADEAIPAVTRNLRENDSVELRLILIRHLVEVGDVPRALKATMSSIEQFGESPDLLRWAADLQSQTGDHAASAATYLKLRKLDPKDPDLAMHAMWELSASKQPELALQQLEDLTRIDPTNPRWSRDLGIQYAQMNKFKEAEPLLRRSLNQDPEDDEVLYQLAQAVAQRGDPSESAALLKRALEVQARRAAGATASVTVSVTPVATPMPSLENPLPCRRRVLAFYKRSERDTTHQNNIHDCLELPLNYLGMAVDYRAVEDAWPSDQEMEPYRVVGSPGERWRASRGDEPTWLYHRCAQRANRLRHGLEASGGHPGAQVGRRLDRRPGAHHRGKGRRRDVRVRTAAGVRAGLFPRGQEHGSRRQDLLATQTKRQAEPELRRGGGEQAGRLLSHRLRDLYRRRGMAETMAPESLPVFVGDPRLGRDTSSRFHDREWPADPLLPRGRRWGACTQHLEARLLQ
jgi:tetratricopeptide (TPR) repeat protein